MMCTFNQLHPNQQIMVQHHFPELFKYLANQQDTFLMNYKLDTGKEDHYDTIQACEVIALEKLEQQEGRVNLLAEVEQCMFQGRGKTL